MVKPNTRGKSTKSNATKMQIIKYKKTAIRLEREFKASMILSVYNAKHRQ